MEWMLYASDVVPYQSQNGVSVIGDGFVLVKTRQLAKSEGPRTRNSTIVHSPLRFLMVISAGAAMM